MDITETLSLSVDIGEAEQGVDQIVVALKNADKIAQDFGATITKILKPFSAELKTISNGLDSISNALGTTTEKINELMGQMAKEQREDMFLGTTTAVIDGLKLSLDALDSAGGIKNVLGGIKPLAEYMTAVEAAAPDVGTFAAMFPKLSMAMESAKPAIQNFGTALLDGVGTLGGIIAGLAKSTAAFLVNTAQTIASTAATWAQVAATTAWQAICTAATAVTTAFGAAMQFLTSPIGLVVVAIAAVIAIVALLIANWDTVKETALSVWEKIKETFATVAQWVDENVLQPIGNFFSSAMEWIGTKVQEGVSFVQSIFGSITAFLQGVFAKDWTEQFGAFGNVLNAFFANVENIWNAVKSIFSGIVSFVKNIFAGDWSAAWDSIVSVFKGIWDYMLAVVKVPVNGIIGLINGLVEGVIGGINLVIKALNNISFDIPSWVPVIGGETFGFNLTTLTAPKIPHLAQGAVLPANRPFLAVVGDQRHGTNVEAPLTTIQEAVAVVLSQQLPALMAGFEAVVNEQRATREMIAQIQIGDDMIANAVHRFDRKMAVMRGL